MAAEPGYGTPDVEAFVRSHGIVVIAKQLVRVDVHPGHRCGVRLDPLRMQVPLFDIVRACAVVYLTPAHRFGLALGSGVRVTDPEWMRRTQAGFSGCRTFGQALGWFAGRITEADPVIFVFDQSTVPTGMPLPGIIFDEIQP